MLVNLNDVLLPAKKNKYAVGLFNTVNLEMAKGVIAAAEELRSPVIIGTAEVLLPYAALEELAYFLIPMAKNATVPVVVHFDHGLTESLIYKAIELGFSSVMYDCSNLNYADNCNAVASVIKYAHKFNVTVEAELGHIGANADQDTASSSMYTEPAEAKDFVAKTNADALAIAIGTAHGAYKSTPKLDFSRLREIAETIATPLVLHGGSGLSESDFKTAIGDGISKINIFTDINCACAKAAVDGYTVGAGMTDLQLLQIEAVKQATMAKMAIFGSSAHS